MLALCSMSVRGIRWRRDYRTLLSTLSMCRKALSCKVNRIDGINLPIESKLCIVNALPAVRKIKQGFHHSAFLSPSGRTSISRTQVIMHAVTCREEPAKTDGCPSFRMNPYFIIDKPFRWVTSMLIEFTWRAVFLPRVMFHSSIIANLESLERLENTVFDTLVSRLFVPFFIFIHLFFQALHYSRSLSFSLRRRHSFYFFYSSSHIGARCSFPFASHKRRAACQSIITRHLWTWPTAGLPR